ncbi:MAG: NUDIX domain-containing protein [Planctomycetia bacterium]
MKSHGPWTIRRTHLVYQDPWFRITRDDVVRPDGADGSYCVVYLKPGVTVVALEPDGRVHLAEEFHYGVGRYTLEAVSGGIEDGESAVESARRELQEEIGVYAESLTPLGTVDPFTASVVSPTQLFLARGLTLGATNLEGTETIRRVTLPLAEAVAQVMDGRMSHAPTGVLLLKLNYLLTIGALPPP